MYSVKRWVAQTIRDFLAEDTAVGSAAESEQQVLSVLLKGPYSRLPEQKHRGDAGFDLYTSKRTRIGPGEFANVPTGVHVEMDSDTWALIMGRSSTLTTRNLLVNTAVIDSGWRGELFAGVKNLNNEFVVIEQGERVAQFIPMGGIKANRLVPTRVHKLGDHDRGINGFGSTGR